MNQSCQGQPRHPPRCRSRTSLLRILIVVNWLGGAAILALLVVMPNEQWIMSRFQTLSFA